MDIKLEKLNQEDCYLQNTQINCLTNKESANTNTRLVKSGVGRVLCNLCCNDLHAYVVSHAAETKDQYISGFMDWKEVKAKNAAFRKNIKKYIDLCNTLEELVDSEETNTSGEDSDTGENDTAKENADSKETGSEENTDSKETGSEENTDFEKIHSDKRGTGIKKIHLDKKVTGIKKTNRRLADTNYNNNNPFTRWNREKFFYHYRVFLFVFSIYLLILFMHTYETIRHRSIVVLVYCCTPLIVALFSFMSNSNGRYSISRGIAEENTDFEEINPDKEGTSIEKSNWRLAEPNYITPFTRWNRDKFFYRYRVFIVMFSIYLLIIFIHSYETIPHRYIVVLNYCCTPLIVALLSYMSSSHGRHSISRGIDKPRKFKFL